ncbi:MAG: N-acetyltransferase family protein [Bacteroidota bacterium]
MSTAFIHLRTFCPEDWLVVKAIYESGIATGQATFQTQSPDWENWEAGHLTHSRLVAVTAEGIVVGWAALSPVSSRAVYRGVAEVSVYVEEEFRGKKVGQHLLEGLISASESHGIWTLQASIFPENGASIHIHQKCGFRQVGYRERIAQLHGVWRNTVLLERRSKMPTDG